MIGSFGRGLVLRKILLATLLLLGLFHWSRADDSLPEELQRCALLAEAAERLVCYDALAVRSASTSTVMPDTAEAPPVEPVPVVQSSEAPAPATVSAAEPAVVKSLDDIGAETLPRAVAEQDDELQVRARVTRCEKDARNKYYFVFENGQVWKQVSDKRLRYRECDFEVTITKDFFGYKMQPDGEKGRIRIDRVR